MKTIEEKYCFFARKLTSYLEDIVKNCNEIGDLLDARIDLDNEEDLSLNLLRLERKKMDIIEELEFQTNRFKEWKF